MKIFNIFAVAAILLSSSAFAIDPFTIEQGKAMFEEHLVAIGAAKYKDLRINVHFDVEKGQKKYVQVLCGKVSAKNRMGVQMQYTYFYQTQYSEEFGIVDGENATTEARMFAILCLDMSPKEAVKKIP